jgi:hypothetical protein
LTGTCARQSRRWIARARPDRCDGEYAHRIVKQCNGPEGPHREWIAHAEEFFLPRKLSKLISTVRVALHFTIVVTQSLSLLNINDSSSSSQTQRRAFLHLNVTQFISVIIRTRFHDPILSLHRRCSFVHCTHFPLVGCWFFCSFIHAQYSNDLSMRIGREKDFKFTFKTLSMEFLHNWKLVKS